MSRKIPVKVIMLYRDQGLSRNMIAKSQNVSRNSVSQVFQRASHLNISYQDIESMSDIEVYRYFFPERYQSEILYKLPNYEVIHKELQKVGVTLKLLWQEYTDSCRQTNEVAVGYTKFCEDYQKHIDQYRLTNHLVHKPAVSVQVDWGKCKALHLLQSISKISPGFRRIRIVALYFIA